MNVAQFPSCREILNHHRKRLLIPMFAGSQLRNRIRISCIANQVISAQPLHRADFSGSQRGNKYRKRVAQVTAEIVEDPGRLVGVDVADDDGRADLPRRRPEVVPAGLADACVGERWHLEGAVGVESLVDDLGRDMDGGDLQPCRGRRR